MFFEEVIRENPDIGFPAEAMPLYAAMRSRLASLIGEELIMIIISHIRLGVMAAVGCTLRPAAILM